MADGVVERPPQSTCDATYVPNPIARPWWFAGLAVAVIQVAWATRATGFFQDDFIFLGQGRISGVSDGRIQRTVLSWDYLNDALFEHFSPITRGLFWLVGRFDEPLPAIRVTVLVLVIAVALGFAEVARAILGRTLPALLVTMIAVQSLVITRLGAWTTACFNILPAVAASAFSLALAFRYLRDPRRRWVATGSVVAYGIACLDYELAMILPAFLGLWVVLCGPVERTLTAMMDLLRRSWVYWTALLVIGLASLANYRLNYYLDSIPRGTIGSTLRTLWYAAWQGLFPAVLGIWSPVAGDFGIGPFVGLIAWVVLVGLALRAAGRSVIPALLLAPTGWLVFTALLGYARSAVNTTGIGIELYYAAFPLLILLVGASEVIARCLAAQSAVAPTNDDSSASASRGWLGRTEGAVVLVLAVVVVANAVMLQVNARDVTSIKGVASAARRYELNFLDSVDAVANAGDGSVAILGTRVPGEVAFASFYPYDWASQSVGQLTSGVRWDDLSNGDLHRIDFSTGGLVPVETPPIAEGQLVEDPSLTTATFVPNDPGCYRFESGDEVIRFAFDPVATVESGELLVVTLNGRVSQASTFGLRSVPADGAPIPFNGNLNAWGSDGDFATVHAIDSTSLYGIELGDVRPGTVVCLESPTASTVQDR